MSDGAPDGKEAAETDAAKAGDRERTLPPAARRALAEAAARREAMAAAEGALAKEIGGRGGREPARYGDWEIKGRAIDF